MAEIVLCFYEALAAGDTGTVVGVLAADLGWWFHGPPQRQHMMWMLTGEAGHMDFRFEPQRVAEIAGDRVVAEGWEGEHAYWVHVWTLEDGVITQFREYFNTWVIVKELGRHWDGKDVPTVWQSQPLENMSRSLPELVLAI